MTRSTPVTVSTLSHSSTRLRNIAITALVLATGIALILAGYLQPMLMGAIQGLGEFLPISSSAHLILVPWFLGWQGGILDTLTFDIALHLGTLVAVVVYFWRDWLQLIFAVPGWLRWITRRARSTPGTEPTTEMRMLTLLLIATIPGGIAGILLDNWAERAFRTPLLLAVTLSIMGALLYLMDQRQPESRTLGQITWRDALLIGVAQACAIIPGVSRSGATITMSRTLRIDRTSAARFSFLLSAPITAAAVAFKLKTILSIPSNEVAVFIVGVLVSGVVGALSIGFLLHYIRRAGFGVFAVYRLLLAATVVAVYVARG